MVEPDEELLEAGGMALPELEGVKPFLSLTNSWGSAAGGGQFLNKGLLTVNTSQLLSSSYNS